MTTIKTSTFDSNPSTAFESGDLSGFVTAINWPATLTDDIAALISAYGCEPDEDHDFWGLSEEDTFLRHPDGRWAIVGLTVQDHTYAFMAR